jgi:hypothetical protein
MSAEEMRLQPRLLVSRRRKVMTDLKMAEADVARFFLVQNTKTGKIYQITTN